MSALTFQQRANAFWPNLGAVLTGLTVGTLLPDVWRAAMAALFVGVGVMSGGITAVLATALGTAGVNLDVFGEPSPTGSSGAGLFNANGLRVVAVLAACTLATIRDPTLLRSLGPLRWYVAFVLYAALSLVWSSGASEGFRQVVKMLYPVAVYCAAVAYVQSGRATSVSKLIAVGAVVAVVINLMFALVQTLGTGTAATTRYFGTLGPNPLGLYSSIAAYALYAWPQAEGKRKLLWLVGLLSLQTVLTGSRTAMLTLCASLAVFEVAMGRWRRLFTVAALAMITWLLVPTLGIRPAAFFNEGMEASEGNILERANLSGRLFLWHDIHASLIQGAPPWGGGAGSVTSFMSARYSTIRSAHSEYLRMWAELGPIGVALFIAAIVTIVIRLYRGSPVHGSRGVPIAAALGALTALLVSSFTEVSLDNHSHFLAILFAVLALGLSRAPSNSREPG